MIPLVGSSKEKVEIVHLYKVGEWYEAQVALDNQLAVPMSVHASEMAERGEAGFFSLLIRQARTLLDLYGDARHQREVEPIQ